MSKTIKSPGEALNVLISLIEGCDSAKKLVLLKGIGKIMSGAEMDETDWETKHNLLVKENEKLKKEIVEYEEKMDKVIKKWMKEKYEKNKLKKKNDKFNELVEEMKEPDKSDEKEEFDEKYDKYFEVSD